MEDETSRLAAKAQELGDLELATLLCLISAEHCIIEADPEDLDHAEHALEAICRNTYGLTSKVLRCSAETSPDEFGEGVLIPAEDGAETPRPEKHERGNSYFSQVSVEGVRKRNTPQSPTFGDDRKIANVVILRDINKTAEHVQIQALELIRSKRIFTRTAMHAAPKRFLMVALVAANSGRLVNHLNDHFFISHYYAREGAEEADGIYEHDNMSTGSVIRSPSFSSVLPRLASAMSYTKPLLVKEDIDQLIALTSNVKLDSDVRAYIHNVVVFMRMHRAVASGVTPTATRHLYALTQALAPLHGIDFITPSLVALAARKIYTHRLLVVKPEDEMSLQWGSSIDAVREYLEGMTAEDIIEEILERVETPL